MFVFRSSILLLLIAVPLLIANKFPSYLENCKNDEKLNECFLEKAQAGISHILKGDPELKIPTYLPLKVPLAVNFGANDLKFIAENLSISPNGISVLEAKWDTSKKTVYLKFKSNKMSWDYDYIFEGKVLGKQVKEKGHGKKLYENGWFSYAMEYDVIQVDGVDYAKIKGGKSNYSVEKISYTFENFDPSDEFNKDWQKLDQIVHPQVSALTFQQNGFNFDILKTLKLLVFRIQF
ncbi:uncharacterized protein CBL_04892 [Carabus blaptoides fortunei]